MRYILPALLSLIFSIIFLIWGIYQIKTGKMVAKNHKYAIDEPREVGILFIGIGIYGLLLAISIINSNPNWQISETFSHIIAKICTILLASLGPTAMVTVGLYELIKQRIFGLKTSPKIKAKIKKFHRPIALCKIFAGIMIAAAIILTTFFRSATVFCAFIGTGFVAILIMGLLLSSIESDNRPKKLHSKKD